MGDLFSNLGQGFSVAFSLQNIWLCFIGAFLGTLVGALPGVGPIATIAILLPITFQLDPTGALIMLAGIYYGAQYGGSLTAILLNLPGEISSVVTTIDGHAMARQGRAGEALAIAAIGSFIAGTVATLVIAIGAPPLSYFAQSFHPTDYFALMLMGLVLATALTHGSMLKGIAMVLLGVLFSLVGTDVTSGALRYTMGFPMLADGIGVVPLAMGLFGIAEIAVNLETLTDSRAGLAGKVSHLRISKESWRRALPAVFRGTGIGAVLGLLPGSGNILGAFASYLAEKRMTKFPEEFGKGAIEGVAGPESANNAGAQTAFIPMLTLGIPSNAVTAMMVGALVIHGITPGPQVITANPDLFWGLVVSMWLGNVMLLVINLPLIGLWVRVLDIPYRFLFPAIVLFCCIGSYAVSYSAFDVLLTAFFGVVGYVLKKLGFEPMPLVLAYVLGAPMEENLRRALLLSRGDPITFVEHPMALVFLLLTGALLIAGLMPRFTRVKDKAIQE
jgi:putative tricarboxylic transport membrane protein